MKEDGCRVADAATEGDQDGSDNAGQHLAGHNLEHNLILGRAQGKRGMLQVGGHAADDLVHGAGHDRKLDQSQRDDARQQGGAQPDGDHQGEAERAIDDGRDAPQDIQRKADRVSPFRITRICL